MRVPVSHHTLFFRFNQTVGIAFSLVYYVHLIGFCIHEHEEIVGYKAGYDFLYDAAKQGQIIDEEFIKKIHSFVLSGKESAGQYRTIQNYVGSLTKVVYIPPTPSQIENEMKSYVSMLQSDLAKNQALFNQEKIEWENIFNTLALHHIEFEKIHPFQDGNGRVGRLIMFKECLKYNIVPFIIEDNLKMFYYRGLKEWNNERGYLTDTCLTAQDKYKAYLDYFRIAY